MASSEASVRPATAQGGLHSSGLRPPAAPLPPVRLPKPAPMPYSERFRRMIREHKPRPPPLRRVEIPISAEHAADGMPSSITAWEIATPGCGNNRSVGRLAICTHALSWGQAAKGAAPDVALHRMLYDQGLSVLAFESHPVGKFISAAVALSQLRAAFEYVEHHAKFRYCHVAILAQGAGASASIQAAAEHSPLFARLSAISVSQPVGIMDLISKHVPASRTPMLLSYAEEQSSHIPMEIIRAHAEECPLEVVAIPPGYPLYGKARRYRGDAYFAEKPSPLLSFLQQYV